MILWGALGFCKMGKCRGRRRRRRFGYVRSGEKRRIHLSLLSDSMDIGSVCV